MIRSPKNVDKAQAIGIAENFCAYQERSQQEVRNKLYLLGLYSKDVEEVISILIENNFLNEERFALAYAGGKFRMKHWGKVKIRQGLKLKKVSDNLINKALKSIDGDDYINVLDIILKKKARSLKESDDRKLNYKLTQYAMSRGFERDLILDLLNNNELG